MRWLWYPEKQRVDGRLGSDLRGRRVVFPHRVRAEYLHVPGEEIAGSINWHNTKVTPQRRIPRGCCGRATLCQGFIFTVYFDLLC